MWPFSRKPERSSAPEPTPATPQVHFDWKGLPSIQRTIADHPLTVPTESFAADLSTHDDPRAVAKPLGHQVSLEAPPGIVLGIARTQTRSDGPDLVPRPHAGRGPAIQRIIDESVAGEPSTAQLAQADIEDTPAPLSPPRRLAPSTEPMPSVQLMRVTEESAPTPIESEHAVPSEEPSAAVDISYDAEPMTEIPSYPRLTLGQARRLGLGAPIKHVPETATSVQRISEVPTRSAGPTAQPTSGIQEQSGPKFEPFILDFLVNTKEEVRAPAPISRPQRIPLAVSRSAIGQPPATAPPESRPETTPGPEPVPESTSEATALWTSEATATSPPTPAVVQRDAEPAEADDVPVQLTPMSGDDTPIEPIAGPPSIAAETEPKRTLLTDAPEGEAGEGEGEALPPLPLALGTSPKASEVSVNDSEIRSSSIVSSSPGEDSAVPPTGSIAPLVSDRPQLVSSASPPITASVQRSPESTTLPIQRAVDAAPAAGRPTSDAGVRRELARSVVAGTPDFVLPGRIESSPSVASRDPVITSAAPMARPSFPTSLPLARSSPPVLAGAASVQRSASTQASSAAERWSPVQASTAVLEPETEEPSLSMQRAPVQEWTVSAAADPAATGLSPMGAGEASPSTPDANDEGRLEDLAAKLYDRIRIRLRNELLVDRERAGFLTDLR